MLRLKPGIKLRTPVRTGLLRRLNVSTKEICGNILVTKRVHVTKIVNGFGHVFYIKAPRNMSMIFGYILVILVKIALGIQVTYIVQRLVRYLDIIITMAPNGFRQKPGLKQTGPVAPVLL
jgi:hypothetical protein